MNKVGGHHIHLPSVIGSMMRRLPPSKRNKNLIWVYNHRWRKYKILSGLCIRCSKPRLGARLKATTCYDCYVKMRDYYRRRYQNACNRRFNSIIRQNKGNP